MTNSDGESYSGAAALKAIRVSPASDMESDWYYAHNNEQKGPVTGADLLVLEQSGLVHAATLVWKAGMAGWQPWASLAPEVRTAVGLAAASGVASGVASSGGAASDDGAARLGDSRVGDSRVGEVVTNADQVAVCAYSGQTRPLSLMVKYGDRWVALEHKEAFLQSLREGMSVARMAGVGETQYVGFWWRVLALTIDGLVLMIPNLLMAAPYYYMSFKRTFSGGATTSMDPLEEFKSMDAPLLIAYVGSVMGGFLISMAYETWMVGKWGATVGKMTVGARVVKAGGERLTYMQSLGRYGAKLVNMVIWAGPAYAAIIVGSLMSFGTGAPKGGPAEFPMPLVVGFVVMMLWFGIGGFGYYMAGWTQRKQALHDMMARTVVVKKNPV